MPAPNALRLMGVLTAIWMGTATAQFASPLSRIPPSYGMSCTVVNADGTFGANPSVCYSSTPGNCVADPFRGGAYFCGIGGSGCAIDFDCAGGARY